MAKQLPAGMRNNNPGNIKFVGQRDAVGPSVNTDQGDPQAVYASPQEGMGAMYRLLSKKYAGGKVTPMQMIAGQGGWTPGNSQAAINVARSMGIGPNDDIQLSNPASAQRFMRALMLQEHGQASMAYGDDMINAAITGAPPVPGRQPGEQTVTDYRNQPQQPAAAPGTVPPLPAPVYVGAQPVAPAPVDDAGRNQLAQAAAPAAAAPAQSGGIGGWLKKHLKTGEQGDDARKNLTTAMSGMAGKQQTMPQIVQPKAARVDDPTIATIDPQQALVQRQQMAEIMAKLNSGKLWG